jgi:hypothetical protein
MPTAVACEEEPVPIIPLSVVLLLTAVSCATSTGGTPASETVRVTGAGVAMTAEIHPGDQVHGSDVSLPIDRAWVVVRAVYDSLHLPIAKYDVATHTIESPTVRLRRRLGDAPLSRYINCGDAQGVPGADSYEVQLAVRTTLRALESGGTSVLSLVNADARPITISGDYARCSTTGKLEARVVALTDTLGR